MLHLRTQQHVQKARSKIVRSKNERVKQQKATHSECPSAINVLFPSQYLPVWRTPFVAFSHVRYAGMNFNAAELMQYRNPVGGGPSSNRCP